MLGNIILIILVLLGVVILAWICFRKLPQLRMLDPSTAKGAQSRQLKYQIMRQRVERASGKQADLVHSKFVSPIGKGMQSIVRGLAGKLTAVERSYQERQRMVTDKEVDKDALSKIVEDGKRLMDEELWDRAEKRFIEVISSDPKNVEAYECLGRLYECKKDYKLAKQTFQFLKKLAPNDASVIASLGEVEKKLGNGIRALKYFQQAVKISPRNPKYLDFMITSAIEEEDFDQADDGLKVLKEVNPNNKKIDEFKRQIKEKTRK